LENLPLENICHDVTLEGGPQKTKTCVCQNGKPKNQSKEYLFGDDDHIIVRKVPYNYRLFGRFVIINHR